MAKHQNRRIPKLSYTENRKTGFYAAYRDPTTGTPKKHVYGMIPEPEAKRLHAIWVAKHLTGKTPTGKKPPAISVPELSSAISSEIVRGSILHVVSGLLTFDESRLRPDGAPKAKGTIGRKQFESRRDLARNFLASLNERHGAGAVGMLKVSDIQMQDVEDYNHKLTKGGYSASLVTKSMQVVKAIIDRAGRPEYGKQVIGWNWDSRDVYHGQPDKPVAIPTVKQLKLILSKCDVRRTAMVWCGIGLGFGQGDLSAARVESFDEQSYDMRRGKTGLDRHGVMPKLVWVSLQRYLAKYPRTKGDLLFVTEQGQPLVHHASDSIVQWWDNVRDSLGDDGKGLNGFYSLRHLGATEFGSRPGCSISAMRGWLGHSASSSIADRYMKVVAPEHKPIVAFVRKALQSSRVSLTL